MTAVILLGHGSRDPRASDAMRAFAASLREHDIRHRIDVAFLDHNRPTLQETVDALPVAESDVVVVPMLLSQAFHAKSDIPAAVRTLRSNRRVRCTEPVGSVDALPLAAAAGLEGPIVLAFSGTSDPVARMDLEALAARVSLRLGTTVGIGYVTQGEPDVASEIRAIDAKSVLCFTLFPGMFTDRIHAAAAEAGIPATPPLWSNPALQTAVVEVVSAVTG